MDAQQRVRSLDDDGPFGFGRPGPGFPRRGEDVHLCLPVMARYPLGDSFFEVEPVELPWG